MVTFSCSCCRGPWNGEIYLICPYCGHENAGRGICDACDQEVYQMLLWQYSGCPHCETLENERQQACELLAKQEKRKKYYLRIRRRLVWGGVIGAGVLHLLLR